MAKKKKLSYWERRNLLEEEQLKQQADVVASKVTNSYLKAQTYLTEEVRKIYKRYINRTDQSEAAVKQILNTSATTEDLVRLKQMSKSVNNPNLKIEAQNYLDGLAVKSRITRLEDLKAKSYLVSKQVADVQLDEQTDFHIDTIHEAYKNARTEAIIGRIDSGVKAIDDGKYKSYAVKDSKLIIELTDKETHEVLDSVKVKPDSPVAEFKELSTKYVKNVLEKEWQGSNYSQRIWGDTELLAKRLEELFTVEAMTGMSEEEMARAIAKEFQTSINIAKRLIRTEANYMANQAKLKGWKDHGVKKYKLLVVLDLRTSEICQKKSKENKVYDIDDAVCNGEDGNFPPFHPWCRTVVVAVFSEATLSGKRIANDPISGETFSIGKAATFDEWEKILIDKHGQDALDMARAKVKNYKSDLDQYNRFKSIIGEKNVPKSFDKFQEMKYNDGSEWERLRDNYFVKSRMKDGRYGSVINPDKQAPHMKSTVKKGKSYFNDDVDVQALFDKYAGTGNVERDRNNVRKNTEVVYLDKNIGIEGSTGQGVDGIKIHHSKQRTHIVPIRRKE